MLKYTCVKDLIDLLEARVSNGKVVFEDCARLEAQLVKILGCLGVPRFEAELLLHDAVRAHEHSLFARLRGHIHRDDAVEAVRRIFGDCG